MTAVYSDADYLAAYKQKQRLWTVFMIVTAVYLAICVGALVYYNGLPYGDKQGQIPKWTVRILSAFYVVFAFVFLAIPYRRANEYYRLLTKISIGDKIEEKNFFYAFNRNALQKEKVDFTACMFERWDAKRQEWQERVAYADPEKPLPPFENGDYVQYILQSNFIVEYKILQKNALEFEEEETDSKDSSEDKGE